MDGLQAVTVDSVIGEVDIFITTTTITGIVNHITGPGPYSPTTASIGCKSSDALLAASRFSLAGLALVLHQVTW